MSRYGAPDRDMSTRFLRKANVDGLSAKESAFVKHIHASLYPFHSGPVNPSFPHQQLARSSKQFCRGTFTTGNDGYGYIRATPVAGTAIPAGLIQFSPGGAVAHNSFANGTNVTVTNSEDPYASFGVNGLNCRVTSCGLRVRNITSMLNRGGTCYALKEPNDLPIPSAPFNDLIAQLDVTGDSWRCSTNGDKWSYIAWCPRDRDQMEYSLSSIASNYQGTTIGGANLAFVVEAPAIATIQKYEWEFVVHYQVIGNSSANGYVGGCTRGIAHENVEAANGVIAELQKKPQVAENEVSSELAPFIANCVEAGHDVGAIVTRACDLASRTAAVLPQVYAATRALGSWL